jgi:hypothetical protein
VSNSAACQAVPGVGDLRTVGATHVRGLFRRFVPSFALLRREGALRMFFEDIYGQDGALLRALSERDA